MGRLPLIFLLLLLWAAQGAVILKEPSGLGTNLNKVNRCTLQKMLGCYNWQLGKIWIFAFVYILSNH